MKLLSRISCTIILVSALFMGHDAHAFNIYRVGEVVKGRTHNDILKRWLDSNFSIWVGVGSDNSETILFKGATGIGDATVMIEYSQAVQSKLESAVSKALEWAGVARKHKADTSKSLGCFGRDRHGLCAETGDAHDENQMGLTFFAAGSGKQTDLIIDIIDRNNQFIKSKIYLNVEKLKVLRRNIKAIAKAMQRAKKTARNQNLFK